MQNNLQELSLILNEMSTDEGTTFEAVFVDDEILEVTCSNNDEFSIHVVMTKKQILTVTPLFSADEVPTEKVNELNSLLLRVSPAVPLSSVGLQDNNYILFGAMSVNTTIENIAHELEVQAENTIDVLETISPLLK
jgi:uncharacterized protein YjfI (DUF2170 family)